MIHPFAHTVCSCGEEGRERKQEGRDKMKKDSRSRKMEQKVMRR